jgi:hypothetical protein
MARASTVTIGAECGSYPGQPASRSYQIHLADISVPHQVTVNGQPLAQVSPGSSAPGWWYDSASATLRANTPRLPTDHAVTVSQVGGRPVTRSESAAVPLTLDPSTPTTLGAGHRPRQRQPGQGRDQPGTTCPGTPGDQLGAAGQRQRGTVDTINGANFGATQGSSYLFFVDGPITG